MNVINRFVICMLAVLITMLAPVKLVWSADENASVAQVYLEFDPATGEFVSVPATPDNSPDGSLADDMAAMQHTQTPVQNTPAQQAAPASQTATSAMDSASAASDGGMSPVLIGSIIAIGLFGGIALMMRKKAT